MSHASTTTRQQPSTALNRRGFLAGATAAGVTFIKPELVFGTQANTKIKLGVVGCGGRGKWIGKLFMDHGGYEIVAAADYFSDRADDLGGRFHVDAAHRYAGLSGYKRVLDAKPDAVVIESPPYFHPEQALAAADAGCHVFVAKPVAVDVPGCLTIADAGKKATENKKCFLVDFQTRASEFYREAIRRVHAGDLGPLVSGEAVYYCSTTWGGDDALAADPKKPENRLRAWGLDRVLSGDVITEQNIHALDVASWIVGQPPVKAYGTCGRKGRTDPGDCHGQFSVVFFFPDDVVISFASKQYGTGFDDIGNKMFGPEGTLETHYFGQVLIRGRKSYKGGSQPGLFTEGCVTNIADFHASILKGDWSNPTVAPSVLSNLTTILGRTAAYRGGEATWDEIMKANEKLEFQTTGLKA